jgi:hypothetical protein
MKMNLYSVLKKSTIGLLLFYVGLVFSQVTTPECVCEDPVNIWYKVSTFQEDTGKVIKLDMSKGKTFADHQFIYLAVKDLDTGDMIYIAFPNGGDWVAEPERDPFLDALDEEFKNLEDYLRAKQGTEIKKKQ